MLMHGLLKLVYQLLRQRISLPPPVHFKDDDAIADSVVYDKVALYGGAE